MLNEDGSLTLEVSVHDTRGTCWMTVPVRLGPYFDVTDSPTLKRDIKEKFKVSDSDCITAISAAARKCAPSHMNTEAK